MSDLIASALIGLVAGITVSALLNLYVFPRWFK